MPDKIDNLEEPEDLSKDFAEPSADDILLDPSILAGTSAESLLQGSAPSSASPIPPPADEEPSAESILLDPSILAGTSAESLLQGSASPPLSPPQLEISMPEEPEPKTPDLKIPELTIPEPKKPEITIPEPKKPEITIPEPKKPEITTPEPKKPEITIPAPKIPEMSISEPPVPPKIDLSSPPPESAREIESTESTDMNERVFLEAVEKDPGNAAKRCNLGETYTRKHRLKKAEAEYKKAIEIDPKNDMYHWSLGQLHEYETGKLVLAEVAYREAVRLRSQNPHNRLCLGRIYEKQGKLAQAEAEYRILSEMSPAYADLVARICEKLGKTGAALEEYQKAGDSPGSVVQVGRKSRKGLWAALIVLLLALIAGGTYFAMTVLEYRNRESGYSTDLKMAQDGQRSAREKLKKETGAFEEKLSRVVAEKDKLKLKERVGDYWVSASKWAFMGQPEKASKDLKELVSIDHGNALAYYLLGHLYWQDGKVEDAKMFYINADKMGFDGAKEPLRIIKAGGKSKAAFPAGPSEGEEEKGKGAAGTYQETGPLFTAVAKEIADFARILEVYETAFLKSEGGIAGIRYGGGLVVTMDDLLTFVAALPEYEEKRLFADTGAFLSGLINNLGEIDEVELDLTQLLVPLNYLGANLSVRNLTIKGNSGLFLGHSMKSGMIILEGDAGICAGRSMRGGHLVIEGDAGNSVGYFMQAGTITVRGDAGDKTGDRMSGGEIIIKGNAGESVGSNMQDGVIHVGGSFSSLSKKIQGGEVYWQDKIVHP